MRSYCLGDFFLLGYIKAGFVTARYRFDSSGIKWRVGENPGSRGGEMHHLWEWVRFLSLICVWAAGKQHLGWLLMASCKWCEIKGCFWGHLYQFALMRVAGVSRGAPSAAGERRCRALCASLAQRSYSSALGGLAPSQAPAAGIAQRFPVKPLGFWLTREHWEWRILTKAFQGLFLTALLPAGSTPCFHCKLRGWGDLLYITPPPLLLPIVLHNFYIRGLLPVYANF